MAGPVPERLAQSRRVEHLPGRGIDQRRQHPGPDRVDRGTLGCQDRRVHPEASLDGVPTETVRVRSEQYPSKTPPKSSTTRSPSTNLRSPARWCGSAELGPEATMVSNAGRSYPAARSAASMTPATSLSVDAGRTAANAASATGVRPAAAARSRAISSSSLITRSRSTARSVATKPSASPRPRTPLPRGVRATLTCGALEADAARAERLEALGQRSVVAARHLPARCRPGQAAGDACRISTAVR